MRVVSPSLSLLGIAVIQFVFSCIGENLYVLLWLGEAMYVLLWLVRELWVLTWLEEGLYVFTWLVEEFCMCSLLVMCVCDFGCLQPDKAHSAGMMEAAHKVCLYTPSLLCIKWVDFQHNITYNIQCHNNQLFIYLVSQSWVHPRMPRNCMEVDFFSAKAQICRMPAVLWSQYCPLQEETYTWGLTKFLPPLWQITLALSLLALMTPPVSESISFWSEMEITDNNVWHNWPSPVYFFNVVAQHSRREL